MGNGRNNRGCPGTARRISLCGVFALLALCASAAPVTAVVLLGGDGSGNTTAPAGAADPGFANVGRRLVTINNISDATAIYLGNRWMITAKHVEAGSTVLNGTTYVTVSQSQRITNPDGSDTDLLLYRIHSDPGLPVLKISDTRPANNRVVTMIGNGHDRETGLTYWDYVPDGNPQTVDYVEIGGPSGADLIGYKAMPDPDGGGPLRRPQTIRWGDNKMTNNPNTINTGNGKIHNFITRFEPSGATANEAQGWGGDSGAAVFYDRPGTGWELAGVILGVGWFGSQGLPPSGSTNAYYGDLDSATFVADLSVYKDKITALVNHIPGDMNADGIVDADDVNWFVMALTNIDGYISEFTFVANAAQVVEFGDVNQDGTFDVGDTGAFSALLGGPASANTVPEPTALSLAVILLLGIAIRQRRRV